MHKSRRELLPLGEVKISQEGGGRAVDRRAVQALLDAVVAAVEEVSSCLGESCSQSSAYDPLALTSTLATLYEIRISPVTMSVTVSGNDSVQ